MALNVWYKERCVIENYPMLYREKKTCSVHLCHARRGADGCKYLCKSNKYNTEFASENIIMEICIRKYDQGKFNIFLYKFSFK